MFFRRCNLSPYRGSACSLFFPASLLLNFFDMLAYAICLLSRQHTLSGFQGPLIHAFYLFLKSVSAICLYPALVPVIFLQVAVSFFPHWHILFPFAGLPYPMYLFFMTAGGFCLFQEPVYGICLQWHQYQHMLSVFCVLN